MGFVWVALAGLGAYGAWRYWKEHHAQMQPIVSKPLNVPMTSPVVVDAPLGPTPAIPFSGQQGSVGPFTAVVRTPNPIWFSVHETLNVYALPSHDNTDVIGHVDSNTFVAFVPTEHEDEVTTHNGMLLIYGWQHDGSPIEGWVIFTKLQRVQ